MHSNVNIRRNYSITVNGFTVSVNRKTKTFRMTSETGYCILTGTTYRRVLTVDDIRCSTPVSLLELLLALHNFNEITHMFSNIRFAGWASSFLFDVLEAYDVDYIG